MPYKGERPRSGYQSKEPLVLDDHKLEITASKARALTLIGGAILGLTRLNFLSVP